MTDDVHEQKIAIVLAGVQRLGALQGFPVHDYALVAETDLDLGEIRDLLWNVLAGQGLDVVAGEHEGSAQVIAASGVADGLPDLGRSSES
jgi:hypothetical protein